MHDEDGARLDFKIIENQQIVKILADSFSKLQIN